MTEPDQGFIRSLQNIAADAPGRESVLSTVRIGYRRRVVQRRWLATGSVVVVVLVVAGATTFLPTRQAGSSHEVHPPVVSTSTSPSAAGRLAGPAGVTTKVVTSGRGSSADATRRHAPLESAAQESAVPTGSSAITSQSLPANSPFVMATAPEVTSPVSVPDSWTSYDPDGPDITSGPGYFIANWVGRSPTAMETIDITKGTTGTGKYRGYLVTDAKPSLDVYAPGYDTTSVSTPMTVNGHAAQYLTAPKGSYESIYITPAADRIAWQLGSGRWIQVWAVGEGRDPLTSFASAIDEQTQQFPVDLSLGLTLKGLTSTTVTYRTVGGPSLTACAPGASGVVLDNRNCVNAFADLRSFTQVLQDFESVQNVTPAKVAAATSVVVVDGRKISVNTALQIGMAKSGRLTVAAWVPMVKKLSAQQLATLAASVQAPADLSVTDYAPATGSIAAPTT